MTKVQIQDFIWAGVLAWCLLEEPHDREVMSSNPAARF